MAQNINNKKNIIRVALICSDLLAILLPAILIYTFVDTYGGSRHYRYATLFGVFMFAASILVGSQTIFEQYTVRRSLYDEFKEYVHIYLFSALAALSSLFIFSLSLDRKKHIIFLLVAFLLVPIFRNFTRHILNFIGIWRRDCLLFCPRSEFKYAKTAIESQFNLGMSVRRSSLESRLLLRLINEYAQSNNSDYSFLKKRILEYYNNIGQPYIIIFSHRKNALFVPKVVDLLILCGLPYSIIPDVGGVSLLGARISHFFRWEVLLITPQNNIDRASFQLLKRGTDIALSCLFISLLFLPMAIICLIVRQDGGPAIFKHQRIGRGGKSFICYKFRTMKINSDEILNDHLSYNKEIREEWFTNHKIENDPRITSLGRFLRAYSLDELPQLFNVLNGEMSLVGPRPITIDEINKYGQNIEIYKKVRPGITGLWQISGRSSTTYSYRVNLDVWYVKNWSLFYDIAIMAKTIIVVIQKTGAH